MNDTSPNYFCQLSAQYLGNNLYESRRKFVNAFQIITLLKYIEIFSCLSESKIEGLEPYSSRFQQIFTSIKKKPYDVLDQRKTEFDVDFDDFSRQLGDLEVCVPYMDIL